MKYLIFSLFVLIGFSAIADEPDVVKTPPPSTMPYDSMEVVMLEAKRVFYYDNELYTGTVKQYMQGGVRLEYEVENGVIQKLLGYFSNGTLEREYNYKNGVEHGRLVVYHSNGMINMDQNFENGSLHGDQVIYDASGEIIEHNVYVRGQKQPKPKEPEPVLLDEYGEWY